MVDDGNVYRFADDRFWVMINTGGAPGLVPRRPRGGSGCGDRASHRRPGHDRRAGPDVAGHAAAARRIATSASWGTSGSGREPVTVAGVPATVTRTGFSGEHGYEVIVAPDDAQTVWDALLEAGAVPFGLTAIDLARTEVGLDHHRGGLRPRRAFPLGPLDGPVHRYGHRVRRGDGAGANEGRTPEAVQDAPDRGEAAPDYGAAVTKDGREVGVVTSPASSPRVGTIGLAVLDADVATDGEKVEVAVGDGTAAATVAPLSILDPQKRRPRD